MWKNSKPDNKPSNSWGSSSNKSNGWHSSKGWKNSAKPQANGWKNSGSSQHSNNWNTPSCAIEPHSKKPVLKIEDLSLEQRQLINYAQAGKNVLVDACIGSGKTSTIHTLCNELPNRFILYLTYNRLLRIEAQERIIGDNVTVTNYHGFAAKCLKPLKKRVNVEEVIQEFIANKKKLQISHYDLLLIDEYQDIDQEISEELCIIKEANPNIQIIAVGDMSQKIYDKTSLNVPVFINNFLGDYELMAFTQCFRLNAAHAARLGKLWNKTINGVNESGIIRSMTPEAVITYLSKQHPADILCLGARGGTGAKSLTSVLNALEERYPQTFNKKTVYASIREQDRHETDYDPNTTAVFTTYDASKGLESKICVVFNFNYKYWISRLKKPDVCPEILKNIFCVAISRGKDEIIFVDEDPPAEMDENLLSIPDVSRDNAHSFAISQMFDYRYKEHVEECFKLLKKRKRPTKDKSIISVRQNDELIDLSPCIGIYQEAMYFDGYDIDKDIDFANVENRGRKLVKAEEGATLEQKVLILVAANTDQDRYRNQVELPFIGDAVKELISKRLATVFQPSETVQQRMLIQYYKENGCKHDIEGICDVIKDDTVWELKFVNELSHTHFLQCACYMIGLHLEKGVLWNVKTNEQYTITIPDRKAFMQAVVKTLTKGRITNAEFPEGTLDVKDNACSAGKGDNKT